MSAATATARPFLDRIGQGWELAKVSLRTVRRRKRIVLLPVLGVLALTVLLAGFLAGTTLALGVSVTQLVLAVAVLVVGGFVLNLILFFLLVLLNAAVAVFALELFDGGTPTVFGSLRRTYHGGRPLAAWAFIAALVSTLLRVAQVLVPAIHLELVVAGFVWTFFVPLVAPIVLFEGLGPIRAVRRSTRIRRSTWVEGVSGLVSVYAMFILLGTAGVLPPAIGFLLADGLGLAIGLLLAAVYLVPLFFAGTTTKSVLVAVVYRYGTTGEIPPEFRGTTLGPPIQKTAAEEPP